jgi:transcriptional regulator with XRE-family HTH domain
MPLDHSDATLADEKIRLCARVGQNSISQLETLLLGRAIKRMRLEKKVSRKTLAQALDVDPAWLSLLENGLTRREEIGQEFINSLTRYSGKPSVIWKTLLDLSLNEVINDTSAIDKPHSSFDDDHNDLLERTKSSAHRGGIRTCLS